MKNKNLINDIIRENSSLSYEELSKLIEEKTGEKITAGAVRKHYRTLGLKHKKINSQVKEEDKKDVKSGVETRQDGKIVINWDTKTIITFLGEFGQIVCSFDMHKAIQRSYVTMGDNKTAAIVAMEFDFAHAKAVHLYAKLHGFTKSGLSQTDIEFENGMTVEDAVRENIQSMKREAYKKTEQEKWKLTQEDANKWRQFKHRVVKPFENHVAEHLPKYSVPKLVIPKRMKRSDTNLVGFSDWHFMKACFDHNGNVIYDKEKAISILKEHVETIIEDMQDTGVPNKIILPIGSDNIHIDNQMQTTTRGTNQSAQTDGNFRIDVHKYIEIQVFLVDLLSQVAPVVIVPMFGNHDKNTAYLLQAFLDVYYSKNVRVEVIVNHTSRTYYQEGINCFIFDHGDTTSISKKEKEIHRVIMADAKKQGINLNAAENFYYVTGHLHFDYLKDLGGYVKIIVLPSITPPDDWHYDSFYVGTKQQTAVHVFNKDKGLTATKFVF